MEDFPDFFKKNEILEPIRRARGLAYALVQAVVCHLLGKRGWHEAAPILAIRLLRASKVADVEWCCVRTIGPSVA